MLLGASSAEASTTIGQLTPTGASPQNCGPSSGGYVQPTVSSGRTYVVPANGLRITSWSTAALPTSGQQVYLLVLRPLGGNSYLGVAHDGPRPLVASALNTFLVNLPVKPGDVLGINAGLATNFPTGCGFLVTGETGESGSYPNPPPNDGMQGTFTPNPGSRANITAEVEVTSAFSFGAVTRNKKKGTATLTINAAGPGTFSLAGKGLKGQQATLGNTTGAVSLPVIATGKVKRKLRDRGKANVSASVTYTPNGGAANTQSEPVKLKKR
jgi:hypothetical protein